MKKGLTDLYEKYIKGTEEKAIVAEKKILLCNLSAASFQGVAFSTNKVYINSRILKHMYDKKPAEEFTFLLENLYKIAKCPDRIYKNKTAGKRGQYCLYKVLKGKKYFCPIEIISVGGTDEIFVVTAYRLRESDNYLAGYELLWEWKGGNPSS